MGAAADDQFGRSAAAPVAELLASGAGTGAGPGAEAGEDMDVEGAGVAGGVSAGSIAAAAASAAAEEEDDEAAGECEAGGGVAKRALWKWACAATARQTAAAAAILAPARYESAVYGAFAGDLRAMLGACEGDWEAAAWAHFRALLDIRVDAAIQGRDPGTPGPLLLDEDDDGCGNVDEAGREDEVMAGAGAGGVGEGAALAAGAAADGAPRWPTPEALAAVPPNAEAILEALGPLSAGGARGRGAQRAVQRCLILGHTRELVVDNLLQWVYPGADLAADADKGASRGGASASAGVGGSGRKPPPGLLRFAVHLLLFLQALLPDGGGLQPGGSLHFHLNKVVNLYVVHLIASRRYELVPRYARHLRPTLLVETYARFLEYLAPASPERKANCLADARPWIPLEGEGGMRAVLSRALDDSREVANAAGEPAAAALSRGPGHRERVLEWACLAGSELHPEAAAHACALVRQLALQRSAALTFFGGGGGADAPGTVWESIPGGSGGGGEGRGVGSTVAPGEDRARGIVAELLPADLQRHAASGGRPGAAAELSDWAGYLAAAAAVSAWRHLATARDAAVALFGGSTTGGGGGGDDGANLAAEAAEAALHAILTLAQPREEDDGFYSKGHGAAGASRGAGSGYWMESSALVDEAEAAAASASNAPPAIRLIAIALPRGVGARVGAGAGTGSRARAGGGGADGAASLHHVSAALREAIEARIRTATADTGFSIACHVDVVRGVEKDGARPEGAAGQIMIELTADSHGGHGGPPPAPGTPPGRSLQPPAAAAAAVRKTLTLVAADAVKGDLPWSASRAGDAVVLEVQSADGSDPEMIRGLCRAVCWPSLLLEGVEIEADLRRGTSRMAETCAAAGRGFFALFSRREMQWLLHLQRQGEVNALAAGLRSNPIL